MRNNSDCLESERVICAHAHSRPWAPQHSHEDTRTENPGHLSMGTGRKVQHAPTERSCLEVNLVVRRSNMSCRPVPTISTLPYLSCREVPFSLISLDYRSATKPQRQPRAGGDTKRISLNIYDESAREKKLYRRQRSERWSPPTPAALARPLTSLLLDDQLQERAHNRVKTKT